MKYKRQKIKMKTFWIIVIIAVVLLALCALAWCLYLSQSGGEQYHDSRPKFRETDLELGELEAQIGFVKPKPQFYSDAGTLRVKILQNDKLQEIPEILKKKHFAEPPLDYTKAKQLSTGTAAEAVQRLLQHSVSDQLLSS